VSSVCFIGNQVSFHSLLADTHPFVYIDQYSNRAAVVFGWGMAEVGIMITTVAICMLHQILIFELRFTENLELIRYLRLVHELTIQ
jgi:hypothetical protein